MSTALEAAVINLGDEKQCGDVADAAERGQAPYLFLGGQRTGGCGDRHLAIEFDFGNQFLKHVVATQQSLDFPPQMWRHRPTVTGAVIVEMKHPSFADPLARYQDAVKRQLRKVSPLSPKPKRW